MSRRLALPVTALLAVALGMSACSHKSEADAGKRGDEGGAGRKEESKLVAEVTVTKVNRADITRTISVSGTVSALPNNDVRVSSLVPGRIARESVMEGTAVKKGEVLAQIDDRPFRDQVTQVEAALEQARANLENAKLSLARNEDLFQRGIAARKELEDARTQVSVGTATVRQAEAALALAKLQLSRTEVRSPLDGVVIKRLAAVGEQVDGTAAQPIFEVANPEPVELPGNVPSIYLAKIRVGQPLPITVQEFPDKKFTGHVVAILPAVDPTTNLGLVRIRIDNRSGLLRLGMFLTVQVPVETHRNAPVVPPQAIYHNEEGEMLVYKVDGDTATAVPVKVGIETPEHVELTEGVQGGEIVILTGGYGLGDKTKVKIKS